MFNLILADKLCTLDYANSYKCIQELETMRKNRDDGWESLEVANNTLENKLEEIGQMVTEIVNMYCKDLLAQCILCEENIDIHTTHIEVE